MDLKSEEIRLRLIESVMSMATKYGINNPETMIKTVVELENYVNKGFNINIPDVKEPVKLVPKRRTRKKVKDNPPDFLADPE